MSSLSDQLLKAGLVTEEQIKKASAKPKRIIKTSPKPAEQKKPRSQKNKSEDSDLALFYKQRSKLEQSEKQEQIRKKQEAAKLKKETNDKINKLINDNLLNDDSADIRYNFVVGTTIKYVFVTEQQQKDLAEGVIAITFHNGKRALIPAKTAKDISQLNPGKIVILND